MIEVLLIDHPGLYQEGLKKFLARQKDISIKDEVFSGKEALKYIRKTDYDVIILELEGFDYDGLATVRKIKAINSSAKILVLNMNAEEKYGILSFREGALGYITHHEKLNDFLEAIHKVAEGGRYVSHRVAENFMAKLDIYSKIPDLAKLSRREYDVMMAVIDGKSRREIGREMHLSISTVSAHHIHMLKKLGLKNDVELTKYLIEEGIITTSRS